MTRIVVEVRKGGICANVFWAAMSLPSHDSSGILMQLLMPLATGEPIALFQPRAPAPRVEPTPQHTLELARKFGCTGMITLSHFLEVRPRLYSFDGYLLTVVMMNQEWAQDPEAVLALSRMKLVVSNSLRLRNHLPMLNHLDSAMQVQSSHRSPQLPSPPSVSIWRVSA